MDLWLEAISSDGRDRNWKYSLSNAKTKDLQTTHIISTIGCSQQVLSSQTLEFEVILDQRVKDRMAHVSANYEWLGAGMTELYQLVIEMRSQMAATYAPSYSPHDLSEDSPPPPIMPLFYTNCIWTYKCLNL
jgi:hypothetical protein